MRETSAKSVCTELYPDGVYVPSALIRSALDQEITCLPAGEVSEHDTRYPAEATSMRAFLEVFFTRHLFQLQNSLMDYAASPDFTRAVSSGLFRVLDIGSGPAVASLALIDVIDRMTSAAIPSTSQRRAFPHIAHALNDTSAICLEVGRRLVVACCQNTSAFCSMISRPQIFPLATAFPGNLHHIRRLASFLGGLDLVVLSYVLHPLTEDENLRNLVRGLSILEQFCAPRGRVLIVQDRFQEQLVRRLARLMKVECREQTLTQEIYPPRGQNETGTYTYYDCLYTPRTAPVGPAFRPQWSQMRQLH